MGESRKAGTTGGAAGEGLNAGTVGRTVNDELLSLDADARAGVLAGKLEKPPP